MLRNELVEIIHLLAHVLNEVLSLNAQELRLRRGMLRGVVSSMKS